MGGKNSHTGRTDFRGSGHYYMITLVRYGFLGYSEANVAVSLGLLSVATFGLFAVNWRMFAKGSRLRA